MMGGLPTSSSAAEQWFWLGLSFFFIPFFVAVKKYYRIQSKMVDLIGFVAFLVIVANSVSAHVIRGNTQAAKCSVTTNWHGWSSVKYAFSL